MVELRVRVSVELVAMLVVGLVGCKRHLHADAKEVASKIEELTEAEEGRPVVVDCGTGELDFTDGRSCPCTLTDDHGTVALRATHTKTKLMWSPADTAAVERELRVRGEKAIGLVEYVHCEATEVEPGVTVRCAITYAGGVSSPVTVAIEADGSTDTAYERPVFNLDKVERELTRALSDRAGEPVIVDCGKGVAAVPADGVPCTAEVGGRHGAFRATPGPDNTVSTTAFVPE